MYDDDTNLTVIGVSLEEIVDLNKDLKNVSEVLKPNKLSLNITKTEYMLSGLTITYVKLEIFL